MGIRDRRYANRVPASTALKQAAQAAPTAAASDGSTEISGPYAALIKISLTYYTFK